MSAIIFQIQSLLILGLMFWGIKNAKNRLLHRKIMFMVVGWDILLILQIELTRNAILKATHSLTNQLFDKLLLNIHISMAITTVVLYFILLYLGQNIFKGNREFVERHRIIGYITVTLRILTFITSFFTVR